MIKFFQRLTKLYEPVGRVQFVSLKKFTSAYLFQIAQEKSCEYILEINMNILTPQSRGYALSQFAEH